MSQVVNVYNNVYYPVFHPAYHPVWYPAPHVEFRSWHTDQILAAHERERQEVARLTARLEEDADLKQKAERLRGIALELVDFCDELITTNKKLKSTIKDGQRVVHRYHLRSQCTCRTQWARVDDHLRRSPGLLPFLYKDRLELLKEIIPTILEKDEEDTDDEDVD